MIPLPPPRPEILETEHPIEGTRLLVPIHLNHYGAFNIMVEDIYEPAVRVRAPRLQVVEHFWRWRRRVRSYSVPLCDYEDCDVCEQLRAECPSDEIISEDLT